MSEGEIIKLGTKSTKLVDAEQEIERLKQGIRDHIGWSNTHIDTTDLEELIGEVFSHE